MPKLANTFNLVVKAFLVLCIGSLSADGTPPLSDEEVLSEILDVMIRCGVMDGTMAELPERESMTLANWTSYLQDRREQVIAASPSLTVTDVVNRAFDEMRPQQVAGTSALETVAQTHRRIEAELAICDEFMARLPDRSTP